MTFANPWALAWGLMAVPLALLYVRKPQPPRFEVGTAMFWARAIPPDAFRRRWAAWREGVSLVALLLLLAALVLAAAGPYRVPDPPALPGNPTEAAIVGMQQQLTRIAAPNAFVPSWVTVTLAVAFLAGLTAEWCLHQRRWMS